MVNPTSLGGVFVSAVVHSLSMLHTVTILAQDKRSAAADLVWGSILLCMVAELLGDLVIRLVVAVELTWIPLLIGVVSIVSIGRTLGWIQRRRRRIPSRWERLVRKLRRVRKQQRYFAYLGHHLNHHVNPNLLRRLRTQWPSSLQEQRLR